MFFIIERINVPKESPDRFYNPSGTGLRWRAVPKLYSELGIMRAINRALRYYECGGSNFLFIDFKYIQVHQVSLKAVKTVAQDSYGKTKKYVRALIKEDKERGNEV